MGKREELVAKITIPKESKLKVDRLYVRKGMEGFDSLTFFLVGAKQEIDRISYTYIHKSDNRKSDNRVDVVKTPKKVNRPVRFWAKLSDVNNIVMEI